MSFYPSTPARSTAAASPASALPPTPQLGGSMSMAAPNTSASGWRSEVASILRELHLHKTALAFQPDEGDHEGKHLDDSVAVHFGGAGAEAAAVVVLDNKLVVLPAHGRARTVRLPLGEHSVGCTASVPAASGGGRPGLLLAMDLPTGTAAAVFYADPLYDEVPLTVELPAANRATCLSMTSVPESGGARVFLGMSDGTILQISLGARSPVCTGFAQAAAGGVIGAAAEVASSWLGGWGSTLLGAAAPGAQTPATGADAADAAPGQPIGALAVVESNGISVLVGLSVGALQFWDIASERPLASLDAPSGLGELRDLAVRSNGADGGPAALAILAQSDAGFVLCDLVSRPVAAMEGEAVQNCGLTWSDDVDAFEWMAIELPPGGLPKLALVGTDSVFNDQAAPEAAPIVHWPRAGKTGRLVARLHAGKIVPARPDRRLLVGADAGSVAFIHGGGGTTIACANDLSDDLCDGLVRLRKGQRDAASSALWGGSNNPVPSVWERLEPLIDMTTPPELWASVVVKGVNSYCVELDAPRPAATSQVGVVTDLLTMTREARELEDIHAMILQKLTSACESQGVFDGDDDTLPPMLLQQAEELAQRSGQALAAYELVKVGQRCEILRWTSEQAAGKRITAEPSRLIALALKALSTNEEQLHAQRHVAPGTRAQAAQEAFELLRELSWRPVCEPTGVTPPQLLYSGSGELNGDMAPHWAFRDGTVLGRVADWLRVLTGLSEDLPETLDDQTVIWAVDCVEALIVGRGLGDDGSAGDKERKRYEALQALCGLGDIGRRYAVQLAERVGDYRTRVQHWLQFDPQQLATDEAAAQSRGMEDHRDFLLKLCDAYYELAAVSKTAADNNSSDAAAAAAAATGGFATIANQPLNREEEVMRLSWLGHLLGTLSRLHEVEASAKQSSPGGMDMDEDASETADDNAAATTDEAASVSYVSAFLAGKPKMQWLFALHNSANDAAPLPSTLPTIAELVAGAATRVEPGIGGNSLRRSLLAVQKLSHAAAGSLPGVVQTLRQQTHALAIETVVAKCPQAGGSNEPLEFDEIEAGMWAFAENQREGRSEADSAALAMIWAWIVDLEKVPWTQLTSGRDIDSSLEAFEEALQAGIFPLLIVQLKKLWLRLTDQDTVGDGVEIDTLVANLLTVDFEAVAALAGLPPAAAEQLPGLLRHALTLSRRAA